MAQAQNVVYYGGVPYLSNQPQYQNTGSILDFVNADKQRNLQSLPVEELIKRGVISPLQSQTKAPPAPTRPPTQLSSIPQAGWGGAQDGAAPQGGSLADILNGSAPQFGAAPAAQAPQVPNAQQPVAQPPQQFAMPSPQKPQRNFDMFAQAEMAKVLNPQGGV